MAERVIVIGGGLAGLAAAQALAERGKSVLLLESKQRFGGRAGSFTDPTTGQVIDTCQHVSMGCCTELARFFRTVGVEHLLAVHRELHFQTIDGRVSHFHGDALPAPFHLARSFWRLHFLSFFDKLRIAWGLLCLRFSRLHNVSPFEEVEFQTWLERHLQSPRIIRRFWSTVLVSALNETIDRIGFKYARKVFVDGFLRDRRGYEVHVPTAPLDRLYGEELQMWFQKYKVELRCNAGVRAIDIENHQAVGVTLRNGEKLSGDWTIAAVPFERLKDLLPADVVKEDLDGLQYLSHSPITSVHLWFDRPVMDLPHVVLVDCLCHWVFSRGEVAPGEWYIQVVISASRQLRDLGNDEIERRVVAELRTILPKTAEANQIRCRVVTDHAATFSPEPAVDHWRCGPGTSIDNFLVAGDWTDTGWPATMEGAVRSGYAAANIILGS